MSYNLNDLFRINKKQLKSAAKTLAHAFQEDPLCCFIFPEKKTRIDKLYKYFLFRINYGIVHGEVYAPSKNVEGVAVWLPGNKAEISKINAMRVGGWKLYFQLGFGTVSRLEFVNHYSIGFRDNVIEQPYWYLAPIGVTPEHQGKGYARILLKAMLNRLGSEKMSCFLETQTEKNVAFYERYGFEVVEKGMIPGTTLTHYGMLRKCR